jgi:hypothetical protein
VRGFFSGKKERPGNDPGPFCLKLMITPSSCKVELFARPYQ